MNKLRGLLVLGLMFIGVNGFSQLHGPLKIEKRKVTADIDYDIKSSSQEGLMFINIVVNRDGAVTSASLDSEKSNVTHLIMAREGKMRAKKLEFEPCYTCPQYHKGVIEYTVEKKE